MGEKKLTRAQAELLRALKITGNHVKYEPVAARFFLYTRAERCLRSVPTNAFTSLNERGLICFVEEGNEYQISVEGLMAIQDEG